MCKLEKYRPHSREDSRGSINFDYTQGKEKLFPLESACVLLTAAKTEIALINHQLSVFPHVLIGKAALQKRFGNSC